MNTGKLTQPFRQLGLMHLVDQVKYLWQFLKMYRKNQRFVKQNPTLKLPSNYTLFEAYRLDYEGYYERGRTSAISVLEDLGKFTSLKGISLLDWGCGPARVVRHMPSLLDADSSVYGTDYNGKTVAWCQKSIPNVSFSTNSVNPPTSFEDNFFDCIYGISIFTHLSEANHPAWFNELMRILKPGGILMITTHGEAYRVKLTNEELNAYDQGELVTRGQVKEGHRVYAAFQPPKYMQQLAEGKADLLSHIPGKEVSWGIEQDKWFFRKSQSQRPGLT